VPFTAFISDLHLTSGRPEINEIFFDFLRGPARAADALYILGDLFEYWAGDDDLADPLNARVASALAELCRSGVPVMLMHGNRDFLMLHGFERATTRRFVPASATAGGSACSCCSRCGCGERRSSARAASASTASGPKPSPSWTLHRLPSRRHLPTAAARASSMDTHIDRPGTNMQCSDARASGGCCPIGIGMVIGCGSGPRDAKR
jgi:hypothetical protein